MILISLRCKEVMCSSDYSLQASITLSHLEIKLEPPLPNFLKITKELCIMCRPYSPNFELFVLNLTYHWAFFEDHYIVFL